MPISGCHDLPLATFNLPSRNNPQNKQQQRPPKQKTKAPRAAAPEGVKESPSDTGATAKKKTKTNPLVPSTLWWHGAE